MKLMTKALEARFEKLGDQDVDDPIVVAKYFNPCGAQTWYATAYYPETDTIFCYVTGMPFPEWGYSSLEEFATTKLPPFGLTIERDLHWTERPFSEVKLGSD